MRRNKSVNGRAISDKKRLQEKYKDRMITFSVYDKSNKRSPYTHNHGQSISCNSNCDGDDGIVERLNGLSCANLNVRLQQDDFISQPYALQQELPFSLFAEIIAATPPEAWIPLTSNVDPTNIVIPNQIVPPSVFPTMKPMTAMQDQSGMDMNALYGSQLQNNFDTDFSAFNQTIPANIDQHYDHGNSSPHHGPSHYHSDPSLFTHISNPASTCIHNNTSPDNSAEDLVTPSPLTPPQLNTTMTEQNSVPPHQQHQCDDMHTRYSPPKFHNGPQYFRASKSFRSCFSQVDADDSGFITLEELRVFLQNKDKTSFNDDTVLTIMDMFDNDDDNMIDSSEFPDMLAFIKNWESCFVFLDTDKSGTIDYSEMITAIHALEFHSLSHMFIIQLLKKYDRAHRGEIDFDNFILACVTLCRYREIYKFMKKKFGKTGPNITLEQFIHSIIWPSTSH